MLTAKRLPTSLLVGFLSRGCYMKPSKWNREQLCKSFHVRDYRFIVMRIAMFVNSKELVCCGKLQGTKKPVANFLYRYKTRSCYSRPNVPRNLKGTPFTLQSVPNTRPDTAFVETNQHYLSGAFSVSRNNCSKRSASTATATRTGAPLSLACVRPL